MRLFLAYTLSLLAAIASLVTMTNAQQAVQDGMTFDSHCGMDYCISGVYSPSTQLINYTYVVAKGGQGQDVGWWAIGQGTQMRGANMAICWVNPDGTSLTVSHRSTQGEQMPTTQLAAAAQFKANENNGKTSSGTTYWSWSMPIPSGNEMNGVQHIFSTNAVGPTSDDPSTTLYKHDRHEQGIVFDLTKPYAGNLPAGLVRKGGQLQADLTATMGGSTQSSTTSSSSGWSMKTKNLFIVHLSFMLIAFLIVFPLGILIARFGRTFFGIYKPHAAVQLVGLVCLFIGFFFAVGAVASEGGSHFSNTHEKLGLALFIIVIVQAILGLVTHEINKRTGVRAVGFVHIPLGLIVFGLSIWQIHLGFDRYMPTAPAWASYVVYAWAALLAAVYVVGFYKLKRELEQSKSNSINNDDKPLHQSHSP